VALDTPVIQHGPNPSIEVTRVYRTKVFNDKLREWEDYYNYHRPHGGLGGQTPYERLQRKTRARV